GGAGRSHDEARRHSLDQFDHQVDRGNCDHHPARYQDRASRLLSCLCLSYRQMAADAATFRDSTSPNVSIVTLCEASAATPSETPAASLPKIQPMRPARSMESMGLPPCAAVQIVVRPKRLTSSTRSAEPAMRRQKWPPMPARRALGD